MQEAIFNEVHHKRYNLAEDGPICQGMLRSQFGYTATSPTAQSILEGSYNFTPIIDKATKELFLETAQICHTHFKKMAILYNVCPQIFKK